MKIFVIVIKSFIFCLFNRNSYHGNSPYTMGITGIGTWKQSFANGFGIHHVSFIDGITLNIMG